jgi:DnaJ-like protein
MGEPPPGVEPVTGEETEGTAGTAVVVEVGTGTGLGVGRVGGGSVGAVTVGMVTVGTVTVGTVTVGRGGIGIVSARAWPASRQAPIRAVVAAAALIPQQLAKGRNGCGVCVLSKNPSVATVDKRDYYEVLGLARDADGETIKRAFHSLARDWHPDVAHAPDAEARFRELAEAYAVLSKREARLLYDRYGYRGRGNQGFDEALWEARPAVAARGENVHVGIELRSIEAAEGTRRLVHYEAVVRCKACMGRGSVGLPDPECDYCGGTGRKRTVSNLEVANLLQIEPCPACIAEPCSQCGGEGTVSAERRIRLLVPPGVQDGAQLRVSGDGNDAGAGSIPGDLLVQVKVIPPPRDPRFVRYTAFVLLIVAIGTLVVYLSR